MFLLEITKRASESINFIPGYMDCLMIFYLKITQTQKKHRDIFSTHYPHINKLMCLQHKHSTQAVKIIKRSASRAYRYENYSASIYRSVDIYCSND